MSRPTSSKGLGDPKKSPSSPWNLLAEDVSLPAAVLDSSTLEHNLSWMAKFTSHFNFLLAPHGKTTMCPQIFHKQIAKGAWGITVATPIQASTAQAFGIRRVLMANQLVGRRNMEIISTIQDMDSSFEFFCIVDSVENVQSLGEHFASKSQKLKVLLEYGPDGGRTGVRNVKQETNLLNEIKKHASLQLVGVEFYEGILPNSETVRLFVQNIVQCVLHLVKLNAFDSQDLGGNVILTGSGSAWFDVVADELSVTSKLCPNIQVILRPGCYVSHGLKMYQDIENRLLHENPIDGNPLLPALTIWAYVQSIPEGNLAIVGMGKRDAFHDCGFPVVRWRYRRGVDEIPKDVRAKNWQLVNMMDQHSYLRLGVNNAEDIAVGDILVFDICHPCTVFDKWKNILLTNDKFEVENIFTTYF